MSDRKDWPPVVGEHFTQAWINLAELPGGMMQGPEGLFGPIPATTHCGITTSLTQVEMWKASGEPVLAIYTAPPTIPADVGRRAMEADGESWVQRIRETAAGLRDNSIRLAKYPGMEQEARARELAALYIEEIATLYEAEAALGESRAAITELQQALSAPSGGQRE